MGFDKPSDLFAMVGVFVIVLLVATLGIQSLQAQDNSTIGENFSETVQLINQSVGNLTNSYIGVNDALIDQSGAGDTTTSESIIVRSWNALKNLGESYSVATQTTDDAARLFGIDTRLISLSLGILLVIFAVIMYAYIRGIK